MAFFFGPYHHFSPKDASSGGTKVKTLISDTGDRRYTGKINDQHFRLKRQSKEGFSPIVKGRIDQADVRIRLGVSWLLVIIMLIIFLLTGINLGQYFMYQFGFRGQFILFGPAPWLGLLGIVMLISMSHQVFQERIRELAIWREMFT